MKTTAKAAMIAAGVALSLTLTLPVNAEESTDLDAFDSIDISSGAEVMVYPSDTFRIVALNEQAEEDFEFRVRRGELRIECDRRCPRRTDAKFAVYGNGITRFEISGGGSIQLDDAFGTVESLNADISGGGYMDLANITVENMDIDIAGGGRIITRVSGKLNVDIAGGGKVEYYGNPKISMDVAGGGTVERRND